MGTYAGIDLHSSNSYIGMGALPVSPRKFMKLIENSERIAIKVYNH